MRQSLYRSMSGRWYSDWVCCCLGEPGVQGVFFFISWDNPFTGVWAGGDIPSGTAAVWWSPGFLLYLMRPSFYRSMSGRWYSGWVCFCLVEPGVRGSSSSFPASTSTRRSTCELRHLTSRPKRSAGMSSKDSVNERNIFWSSLILPSLIRNYTVKKVSGFFRP